MPLHFVVELRHRHESIIVLVQLGKQATKLIHDSSEHRSVSDEELGSIKCTLNDPLQVLYGRGAQH